MKGYQHLLVNAGFIEMFCKADHKNTLFGDSAHLAELQSVLSVNSSLELFAIPVLRSGSMLASVAKTTLEFLLVCFVFAFSLLKHQEVLFLSSYPSVKTLIELLSRIHPHRVFIIHHGELAGLDHSAKEKRYAKFVQHYFSFRKSKKLTDVFLSKGIRDNALRLIERKLPSSLALLHPFPSSPKQVVPSAIGHLDPAKKTIGYFGTLTKENFPRVQKMIDAFSLRVEKLGWQDFNFLVITQNPHEFNYGDICADLVDTVNGLSQEEYSAQIANLDIAIFPYRENQYELTASGIASDCFINKIHFLAARSTFFTDWTEVYEESATLFDSYEQLLSAISNPAFSLNGL